MMPLLDLPQSLWIEMHDTTEADACDVIVQMDSGCYYTAIFVTLPYLARQMELSYTFCRDIPDTAAVRYAVLETPHIVLPDLRRETIEDTIDTLLALDTFANVFTRVTEDPTATQTAADRGRLATAEVAAVVLNEVLRVEGDPTS